MIARFHIALRKGSRGRLLARVTSTAKPGEKLIPITLHVPDALFKVYAREVTLHMPAVEPITGTAGAEVASVGGRSDG